MKTCKNYPDYKKIYTDILNYKHPEKIEQCKSILSKPIFSFQDVININKMIFGPETRDNACRNQKHRSYNESSIIEILDYQRKNRMNNIQLANHFNLSKNTVTKWKKIFNG
ncbi:helix-turn-helix domain-containing protein [Chryseobacterium sp. OSA05B]|uniref:helix-turn-helix domain-containing protein n=1 Tax=Chryseobacterium sp. OSA05B TaxID=2862650 RepID=UPI001CBA8491|nr:helix-turn-helix domain-containing protein [Chryseobacterium sp. OSA05B]